ncbi:chromate transporter [Bacteroidales bacterium OttesenSCG-928-K03]|nr:chromate transporter [Odoribacter sp. OttesenSCG-928-L07]MDL2238641.1 chromate transporter [Bacteroidales bacterium OttesenSCG-928-L14]MDL2240276.1 chromate transporter [Bacteroidales bacterium OttesenSCG-928-K22]MDL2242707.1 chromate transporter [Bacteroidales bacterium OttesenSCG-928-K03]
MIYLQLFWTYFKIGLLGFGGGYAMLSFIQTEVVEKHQWISMEEFTDIVAISQMTPGPIGINSATYIGYTVTGNVWGSIIATLAICIPSLIIVITISYYYNKFKKNKVFNAALSGLRPATVGLIAAAVLLLITPQNFIDYKSWIIFGISFLLVYFAKLHPIVLILIAGGVGYLLYGL